MLSSLSCRLSKQPIVKALMLMAFDRRNKRSHTISPAPEKPSLGRTPLDSATATAL